MFKPVLHIIIGLMILLFLFAEAGNLLLWHAQRANHSGIVLSDYSLDDQIVHFVCNQSEFAGLNWQKQNKEFVLNGEFYDVKQIKKTKAGYLIICKRDSKDKELFSHLRYWLGSNHNNSHKSVKPVSKFIVEGTLVAYGFNIFKTSVLLIPISKNQNILAGFRTINDHPPKG